MTDLDREGEMDEKKHEPLIVDVTEEDIAIGRECDCMRCPIARAVNRAYPPGGYRVHEGEIDLDGLTWGLPDEACDFVFAFDIGDSVEPFTFTAQPRRTRD